MFDSPVLQTVIGLVFIFLIYSLLATSVNEALASLFALRARMLRKGIIKGMLSNTRNARYSLMQRAKNEWHQLGTRYLKDRDKNIWRSLFRALANFFQAINRLMTGRPYAYIAGTLGGDFYLHPLIRNFGSSRRFAIPSYISRENFSSVLMDLLEKYYEAHSAAINALYPELAEDENLPKLTKIRLLLDYLYAAQPNTASAKDRTLPIIDRDTLVLLQMLVRESGNNAAVFSTRLESWFDSSMDRVSGWYKRQGQTILFFMGLAMALVFNVDIVQLAGRLSADKNARAELVRMAEKAAEQYKDDPRIIALASSDSLTQNEVVDSIAAIKAQYRRSLDSIKGLLNGDIAKANSLLALGWDDFGRSRDSLKWLGHYRNCFEQYKKQLAAEDETAYLLARKELEIRLHAAEKDPAQAGATRPAKRPSERHTLDSLRLKNTKDLDQRSFETLWRKKGYVIKPSYVAGALSWKKGIGFLLFAFGICLGAPFWFDLLNRFINIRAAGKKVDAETPTAKAPPEIKKETLIIQKSKSGEEAVG